MGERLLSTLRNRRVYVLGFRVHAIESHTHGTLALTLVAPCRRSEAGRNGRQAAGAAGWGEGAVIVIIVGQQGSEAEVEAEAEAEERGVVGQ